MQAQAAVAAPFDLVFTFSGGMTASPEIYSHYALGDPQVTIDTTTYEPVAGQLIQNSGQSGGQVISLIAPTGAQACLRVTIDAWAPPPHLDVIDLDASYDQVVTGSWAVIERADLPVATPAA